MFIINSAFVLTASVKTFSHRVLQHEVTVGLMKQNKSPSHNPVELQLRT